MKNFEKKLYGGLGALLAGTLVVAACAQEKNAETTQTDYDGFIAGIARIGVAIIINYDTCPSIKNTSATAQVRQETKPSVAVVQADVQHGEKSIEKHHEARITTQYTVDTAQKSISVYCGPDSKRSGEPFEGVMLVSATTPNLVTDTTYNS